MTRFPRTILALLALAALGGCNGGGGSSDGDRPPRSNIDLAVTNFTVTPVSADPEDKLLLTGTIKNLGTETANPLLGDAFHLLFSLSTDGTIELNEQGFLDARITDPIPPGGSLSFSYQAAYGDGDTQVKFGNFCNSTSCYDTIPESGVIGVQTDSAEEINELEEGNNFGFQTIEVAGTRVAVAGGQCNFGFANGPGSTGCDITLIDGFQPTFVQHRPCNPASTDCDPIEVAFPNELHRFINVFITLRGCTLQSCGGTWTLISTTTKKDPVTGNPITETKEALLSCTCVPSVDGPTKACTWNQQEIRSPGF